MEIVDRTQDISSSSDELINTSDESINKNVIPESLINVSVANLSGEMVQDRSRGESSKPRSPGNAQQFKSPGDRRTHDVR